MKVSAPSPWPLLLSRLRQSGSAVVAHHELAENGLDPEALLRDHLIERQDSAQWRAPGCERHCVPNLDLDTRRGERLVGVACPDDPACWPGWTWYPVVALADFRCSAEQIFAALRERNDLLPLEINVDAEAVPVGLLARRGRRIPVVWMRRPGEPSEVVCRGIREAIGADSLVVLVNPGRGEPLLMLRHGSVVILDVPHGSDGDFRLWRALDALDPGYRQGRASNPAAIFDDVAIEFSTIPGERHIVRINGCECEGFCRSDLKFSRLLYLAAVRAADSDVDGGGWTQKWRLQGDEKDHDIEALRKDLGSVDHPELSREEMTALIKGSPARDGNIRLAVHPRHVRFDPSLADVTLITGQRVNGVPGGRRRTPGATARDDNLRKGQAVARQLLENARKLGVPGGAGPRP